MERKWAFGPGEKLGSMERGSNMPLTREEIGEIATRTADKVMERISLEREECELRDHIIAGAMGKGAIPLYGRETRKEPCACCLIDPEGPNAPENRMCTTKGAIGTLSDREEREWCSEIKIVSDGRCARARSIREAARVCKEKYPTDTAKFFECYAPAFSKITKGSNPGAQIPTKYLPCPICIDGKQKPRFIEEGLRYHLREFHKRVDVDELVELAKEIKKGSNPGTSYQEEGERIARQLGNGVIYNGPQMYQGEFYAHLFTDAAVTGTTFACLGLEECKAKLIQKRKDFGAAPPTFS